MNKEDSLDSKIIREFMKAFQVPSLAEPYLGDIFIQQEIFFAGSMEKETFTLEDIRELLGAEAEEFRDSAYRRGILSYVDASQERMKLADFYERMDIMAISEQEQYRRIPKEGQEAICRWAFEKYYHGLNPDASVRPTQDEILPLDEVLDFIEERRNQPVYLNNCDCKSLNGQCGKPRDTCITYKDGINTYVHRGHGKRIDADQAKEVVKRADRAGLMHTVNPTGICNCCNDCCYLFRSQQRRGSAGFWPKTEYVISLDPKTCIGCGLCTKRCMFQVLQKENKEIRINPGNCVGCGICANTCPAGALKLVKRKK